MRCSDRQPWGTRREKVTSCPDSGRNSYLKMITYTLVCSLSLLSFGNVRKPLFRGEVGIGVGSMTKYCITGWVILYFDDSIYHDIVFLFKIQLPDVFQWSNEKWSQLLLFFSRYMCSCMCSGYISLELLYQ